MKIWKIEENLFYEFELGIITFGEIVFIFQFEKSFRRYKKLSVNLNISLFVFVA